MLIQAAHHLYQHPGPGGNTFRRLAKRKPHNAALTAVARKLVVVAWHMLSNNKPYRYAGATWTQRKLARVRVKFGETRMRGRPPTLSGQKPRQRGKPLAQVYLEEGLPELQRPPGEERMLSSLPDHQFLDVIHNGR